MPKKRKAFRIDSRVKAANSMADKYRERQQSAVASAKNTQAQRNHAAEVAKMAPMESPLVELLRAARSGDDDAMSRADALYGDSWRVKRRKVA